MESEKKKMVKKTSKQLAVELREKQMKMQTMKQTCDTLLKEHRIASDKELMDFKRERTGMVRVASERKKAAIAKARSKRDALTNAIETELKNGIRDLEITAAETGMMIKTEYSEIKKAEETTFREIADAEEKIYQPDLDGVVEQVRLKYRVLEQDCDMKLGKLRKEISDLEAELEKRRGPMPPKCSEPAARVEQPSQ